MRPTRAIAFGRSAVVAALFALACAHGAHADGPAPASADPDGADGAAVAMMVDTGDAGALAARVSARFGALRGARALLHQGFDSAAHECSEKDCVGPLMRRKKDTTTSYIRRLKNIGHPLPHIDADATDEVVIISTHLVAPQRLAYNNLERRRQRTRTTSASRAAGAPCV